MEVEDPLGLQSVDLKRLFLGSFVWGEIEGKEIEAGYLLNRSYLRDNNTVWLVAEDGNLEVRHVEAVFKNENSVIIADGLVEGEKLVVSSISSPVAGMKIRIEGSGKNSAKTTKKKKLNEGAGER